MVTKTGGPSSDVENQPAVSARTGVPLDNTVSALLSHDDYEANESGLTYLRKVFALLFLQYAAVLTILSPFCLIASFKRAVSPTFITIPVNTVCFFGLLASIYFVATKGHIKWYARSCLFSVTVFVAVGLGFKLAKVEWSNYALIAVGQSTVNFALLLAVTQFDSRHLKWLRFHTSILLLLFVSGLWMLILRESGSPWLVAITVPLGGWAYCLSIILNIRKSLHHREPNDYLLATIFILGPPIPDRFIPTRPAAVERLSRVPAVRRISVFLGAVENNALASLQEEEKQSLIADANGYGGAGDSQV